MDEEPNDEVEINKLIWFLQHKRKALEEKRSQQRSR